MRHQSQMIWSILWAGLLVVRLAGVGYAGDPPAHTAAMVKTAKSVAELPRFGQGVGAPKVDGVLQEGLFYIPTDGREDCPYPPDTEVFPTGCSYESILGEAINAPDSWGCCDPRQPEAMNSSNVWVAPGQTFIADLLRYGAHEAAMVCNWNHFLDNSALRQNVNQDSSSAYELTMASAREIVDTIQREGATTRWGCDDITWRRYVMRVANALHYTQDAACEHHAHGNLLCNNTNIIPVFSRTPIVDLAQGVACMEFLTKTLKQSIGNEPLYWCDQAVVADDDRSNMRLNLKMALIVALCGVDLTGSVDAATITTPKLSLACMGLERTLRHHCYVEAPKSIFCSGKADDHLGDTTNEQYCEGEIHSPAGGENFLQLAQEASIPIFEEAMDRWADVCKQPDDPCSASECHDWCRRSQFGSDSAGYCVNDAPDEACVLHQCECSTTNACGSSGQPCCHSGARCTSGLQCDARTGRCTNNDVPNRTGGVAPIEPPECEDANGEPTGVCPRLSNDVSLAVPGNLQPGAGLHFRLSPTIPACDSWPNRSVWNPSPCYSGVRAFSLSDQCVYRDLRDGEYKSASCSSIFYLDPEEQAVSWSSRVDYQSSRYTVSKGAFQVSNCGRTSGAFDVYIYGGDARYALAKWSSLGPRGLRCQVTYTGPRPDGLYGPTWIKAAGGLEIESNDGEGRRTEIVEVYLPVEGDLRELCVAE